MMTDNVNHPSHYTQGGVECIDAITAATVNKTGIEAVCTANVIKYLWRYEGKNGLEDVKKAQWYLNRLIAEMEGKAAVAPESECKHKFIPNPAKLSSDICCLCGIIEPLPTRTAECAHVWYNGKKRSHCLRCGKVEDVCE